MWPKTSSAALELIIRMQLVSAYSLKGAVLEITQQWAWIWVEQRWWDCVLQATDLLVPQTTLDHLPLQPRFYRG